MNKSKRLKDMADNLDLNIFLAEDDDDASFLEMETSNF